MTIQMISMSFMVDLADCSVNRASQRARFLGAARRRFEMRQGRRLPSPIRMFHTDCLRIGGTGYQPVLVGNLPTRLGRSRCRDEEMQLEKFDVASPRAGSPAARAGCPCHLSAVKY